MTSEKACILCQINRDKLPHYELLSDSDFKVVLDINPITAGHLLIISRSHQAHLGSLPPEESRELLALTNQLSTVITRVMPDITDTNIIINNGPASGQHIAHVHVHIIPRRKGDTLSFYWRLFTRFINPFSSMGKAASLLKVQQMWLESEALNRD
ncbi:HIT domain-containing protein [Shewanella corallii]|uniref:HIT domain-containing protein n=1 Tax=Shewanella corallii TaxID=560080 RepID=A0ABT0N7S3_9GAMM|nr:HIT family protein [Shewanella corallii]MCL2914493.1 HIT domain-containing protein [Shewanella corallii]